MLDLRKYVSILSNRTLCQTKSDFGFKLTYSNNDSWIIILSIRLMLDLRKYVSILNICTLCQSLFNLRVD